MTSWSLSAAAHDDVREALSLGGLRQPGERTERRDHRREGVVVRVHREDLLEAGDQEDAVVRLAHHRTELAQRSVVGTRIPDQLGIGEEVAVEGVHRISHHQAAREQASGSRSWILPRDVTRLCALRDRRRGGAHERTASRMKRVAASISAGESG